MRTAKQWLLDNDAKYDYREDFGEAGSKAMGIAYDTVIRHILALERDGLIVRKTNKPRGNNAPVPQRSKPTIGIQISAHNNAIGLSRQQARLKHDIPARLEHDLNSFIDSMAVGMLYEDAQVRKACRVANSDKEYWEETIVPAYAMYHGTTESGMLLWGTEEDMQWADNEMTGFRRSQ